MGRGGDGVVPGGTGIVVADDFAGGQIELAGTFAGVACGTGTATGVATLGRRWTDSGIKRGVW